MCRGLCLTSLILSRDRNEISSRDEIHQKMHVNTSSRDEIVKIADQIAVNSANCLLSNAIFLHISHSSTLFEQSSFRVITRKTRTKHTFYPGMKLPRTRTLHFIPPTCKRCPRRFFFMIRVKDSWRHWVTVCVLVLSSLFWHIVFLANHDSAIRV